MTSRAQHNVTRVNQHIQTGTADVNQSSETNLNSSLSTTPHSIQLYGTVLLIAVLVLYCNLLYTIIITPIISAFTDNLIINHSYTQLMYISVIPFCLLSIYFNWLGLSLFRNN